MAITVNGILKNGNIHRFNTEEKRWEPPIYVPAEIHEQLINKLNKRRMERAEEGEANENKKN